MKTVRLNVFEMQREWMERHRNADTTVCNNKGEIVQAIYKSPLEQWRGMIASDGTVQVPDMDYYNSLQKPLEIRKAIKDIFSQTDNADI